MTQPCIIEVNGLTTRYGEQVVHRNIDLCVVEGEILAIVGGSGSGKTTLLRLMLGLERPTEGRVRILGQDWGVADAETVRRLRNRCGVLFQQGALFSALNVFDNIALPLRELRQLDERLVHDLVMLKLNMVGLKPDDAWKMPAELSGGMVKRVGLARALALEPELLFLDEPTSGLDPIASDAFVQLIRTLREQLNLTVVMVTHDLDTLFDLGGRVAVLADQHIVALGSLSEVLHVDHPFIHHYFSGERGRRITGQLAKAD